MDNNYILRSLRYALNINDATMLKIFVLGDHKTNEPDIISLLKKEEDNGFLLCSNEVMRSFLDGLIIYKRGVQENALNNNVILKKIRIALNFREDEMLATFKLAGLDVKKPELTAIFRRPDHKNYKECGDQFIRNFLKGLALKNR
jgi:uncharacterized protein YehS (DUF1456 family)